MAVAGLLGMLALVAIAGSIGPPGGGPGGWPFVAAVPMLVVTAIACARIGSLLRNRVDGENGTGGENGGAAGRTDDVERLKRGYVEGELSEAEFERRLERRLDRER